MSTEPTFADFAHLSDRAAQTFLRSIDQKDLVIGLVGAPRAVKEKFLSNMSERVRGFIAEEIAAQGDTPKDKIKETRQRMINQLVQLAEQGQLTLGKSVKKAPKSKARFSKRYLATKRQLQQITQRPFQDLSYDEINEMLVNMAEVARREGILELENVVRGSDEDFLGYAVRLIVDGTEPALVMDILETWKGSLMREHARKYEKAIEGVMAIQGGDNPRLIESKITRLF